MNIIRIVFLLSCVLLIAPCKASIYPEGDPVEFKLFDWQKTLSEPQKTEFIKYLQAAGDKDAGKRPVLGFDLNANGTPELIVSIAGTGTNERRTFKILTWKNSNEWSEIGEIPHCITVMDDGSAWKYLIGMDFTSDTEGCLYIYRYIEGKYRLTEKRFFTYQKTEKGPKMSELVRIEKCDR